MTQNDIYRDSFKASIRAKSTESLEKIHYGIDEGFEHDAITEELLRRYKGKKMLGHLKVRNPIALKETSR